MGSNLALPFRYPTEPIQPNSRRYVDADVDPHEPKISPAIVEINVDRVQELRRGFNRTVLAETRC